jgi:hypothetical protein|tara:strand:- start:1297 stop:1497 length:201 start_codon:yes stop_codon:yes gene_type:complete
MNEFVTGFEILKLNTSTPSRYNGPDEFARQFKKCTAVKPRNISYSTTAGETKLEASQTNQSQIICR